jgi:coenzyme F420-0:L-glutamate ligase/coenzyme F420-1:gamma-L-glutamate ligase
MPDMSQSLTPPSSPQSAAPATDRPPSRDDLAFVAARRVGRLATVRSDDTPAVVPICYAVVDHNGAPTLVSPLDEKPKSVPNAALGRVRHIAANPAVTVVVDDYDEDWTRLAWVRLRGRASIVHPGESGYDQAITALRAKYPQYERMAIDTQPLIRISSLSATSWRSTERSDEGGVARPTDLAAIIQGRRSVRAFDPRPVPRATIERAIAAAGWAPSPHGRQPWRFAVVEQIERRRALAEAMAATWRAQLSLDGQDAATVAHRLARSQERLTTAPVLVIPCLYLEDLDRYPDEERQHAETTMAIQSFGAAIQNFLLTIYAAGLDSGWMCAPLFCPDVVRDVLGLAPELIPHALLPVGYPAKDPVRRPRRRLDELIVSWE